MRADGNDSSPLRLIVGGGIGSGKSTVTAILAELGAVVVEADRIGHEILAPGGTAFETVSMRWPSVVVAGRIDRKRLAAIVFTDHEQLAELEAITHPLIAAEIAAQVAAAGERDVVLELPLRSDLAGPGWTRIVVDAPADVRLARAVSRGMAADDVANRIAEQPVRDEWVAGADLVIENTGTVTELDTRVRQIWATLHQPE